MLSDIHTLPSVGGTAAGRYVALADDVLLAIPRPGYMQTEAGARASLAEATRIIRERGRRHVLVILMDGVASQDGASRKVWQEEVDPGVLCAMVLVAKSLLARAIGSFFIGLRRPTIPTRMTTSVDDALRWAQEQLAERGGPLDT